MSRKIVFKKPKAGGRPAIRVEFREKFQEVYFSLRNIAEMDFKNRQTKLARMILCDWVAFYETRLGAAKSRMVEQLKLTFGDSPEKEGGKNGRS